MFRGRTLKARLSGVVGIDTLGDKADHGRMTPRGQAGRAALLEAGLRVFAKQGFGGATISEIAAGAGTNRAMIAYHFGGKEGLYKAILDELVGQVRSDLQSIEVTTPGDDSIGRWVRCLTELYRTRPELARLVVRGMLDGDFRENAAAGQALAGFYGLSEAALANAPLSEAARGFDPHLIHLICVGAVAYFALTKPFRSDAADALAVTAPSEREFADTLAAILTTGLTKA